MAGLEGLTSMIYHEKQQEGSMLCAQHALNSLLQGNYFTAPDLSDIARNLDALEESYDDERGNTSTNMDDTGFFSVQVLENALKVWGLNLVRWRSETMRPYHDHPHTQLGFILNLQQHWFALRRFGPAVPNVDSDPGEGHWFNLNSFLKAPEWVGKLYLGMVLQQAETEGYSVFAVVQADPGAPLALPRVLADEVAATLPEPTASSSSTQSSFRRTTTSASTPPAQDQPRSDTDAEHFDEEDYELQAALQASLMPNRHPDIASADVDVDDDSDPLMAPPPLGRATIPLPDSNVATPSFSAPATRTQTPHGLERHFPGHLSPVSAHDDLDPVAASMERSRQLLQQMQAQQEYAQRELWSDADLTPEEAEALRERRERRRRQEEQEEEELRLAIEESERISKEHGAKRDSLFQSDVSDSPEGDEAEDQVMGDASTSSQNPPRFPPAHFSHDRVYDDDDAELQAALKASLEGLPEGWEHPDLPELPTPSYPPSGLTIPPAPMASGDLEDNVSIASTDTSMTEAAAREPSPEPLSIDEIRRRRLAKFGM